jgi:hypothetical protein
MAQTVTMSMLHTSSLWKSCSKVESLNGRKDCLEESFGRFMAAETGLIKD